MYHVNNVLDSVPSTELHSCEGGFHYYSHFADEETKAQRGCLTSHSQERAELGFTPACVTPDSTPRGPVCSPQRLSE